ncbi:PhoX family protein [Allomesorhizobium alhagi]|uniref:Twin-arginine translocation pathway signal sequence domain-containing protein n=1 Tax=Mesorhizobium alhagi CCNWXJ12-2 TaxID=1107882 RepID=H0I320_9HYPH|nr:PhoX family phosphatase [Mesorhizobium alhagi]EHK52658.1 Twin-arginine translocation pathway signal sequence domain-containing protein [Mesorhizobium alhagi CCNWXJ12-2]
MKDIDPTTISADEWDELKFPRPKEQEFDRIVERAISRRGFLGGVLAFGSGAAVMGTSLLNSTSAQAQQASRFAFKPIPTATDSTVHVPDGYSWDVLIRWGDPLFSEAEGDFTHETGGSVAMSDKVFGENTDGMELFVIGGAQVIAVNHEYTNNKVNLPKAAEGMPASAEDVRKLQNLHGIAVMEVRENASGWEVVKDSSFNRRITHNTPMRIAGPAAGHDLMKTAADPTGTECLGTFNNCGSGKTPWGTYLTCEENFNGYFGAIGEMPTDEKIVAGYQRYGIEAEGRYGYEKFDARFDVSQTPNEPHRAGWIVEIDPSDASSMPVKRTALGRFKHENAACVLAPDGRVVVYMGDDERGEFLYKWLSRDVYVPGGDTSTLLDEGMLYVAKFNEDQTGTWLALTPEATDMSAAEIAIFTRTAASKVGATTMDRPEWVAVNPTTTEAYCCLTNNSRRGAKNDDGSIRTNAGGDEMTVNAVNPRETNEYGQIVRWRPAGENHASSIFEWDLYVMAGNPSLHTEGPYAGSGNVNAGNMFNSPDGMIMDSTGLMWIQTDGDDSNEGEFAGQGNNQMLVGDPVTGEIHRFLTGPVGCEVTGLCWSADRRTMFVGIQHPDAPFPDGEGTLPRSSIIAIKRDDNALLG